MCFDANLFCFVSFVGQDKKEDHSDSDNEYDDLEHGGFLYLMLSFSVYLILFIFSPKEDCII